MSQKIDPALVQRVTQGDRAALGELLESQQQRLYNIILRMVGHRDDAAELTQETMLKIVEHIGDYNGQAAITTWMIRIAMNLSISHLRKVKLRRTASLDAAPGHTAPDDQALPLRQQLADTREPPPDQSVQQKETVDRLFVALGQIDPQSRTVLILRDLGELDYRQMASVLGLPLGTVKSRLFRARLALRQQMCKLDGAGEDASAAQIGTTHLASGDEQDPSSLRTAQGGQP